MSCGGFRVLKIEPLSASVDSNLHMSPDFSIKASGQKLENKDGTIGVGSIDRFYF